MKTLYEAETVDGTIVCKHEVEVICAHCGDPVSEHEESTGTCSNWGALATSSIYINMGYISSTSWG